MGGWVPRYYAQGESGAGWVFRRSGGLGPGKTCLRGGHQVNLRLKLKLCCGRRLLLRLFN